MPLEAVASVDGGELAVAERRLIPMDRLLTHLPAVVVSDLGAKRASHGGDLRPEDFARWPRRFTPGGVRRAPAEAP